MNIDTTSKTVTYRDIAMYGFAAFAATALGVISASIPACGGTNTQQDVLNVAKTLNNVTADELTKARIDRVEKVKHDARAAMALCKQIDADERISCRLDAVQATMQANQPIEDAINRVVISQRLVASCLLAVEAAKDAGTRDVNVALLSKLVPELLAASDDLKKLLAK